MRVLSFLFLVVFLGAVGVFVYQNQQPTDVRFLNWNETLSLPVVVGASYLLGMLSGWSVVGILRRSVRYVTDVPPEQRR